MTPRLRLNHITKAYPGIVANDDICLEVCPGEVLAILGENGAGKSTLMKIIFGSVTPDKGFIEFDGSPAQISSPSEANRLGIAMVHQHFAVFETLTVAQNVILGIAEKISVEECAKRINALGERYGIAVDPFAIVADLSMGERQRVEIIRALMSNPKLLILDEPTRGIDVGTKVDIQKLVLKLASEGMSVTFISSETDEMLRTCSRLIVMRDRRVVGELSGEDLTQTKIMSTIAGGESKHE